MMTLLYLLLLPMLSGIGMLGLGPALMAGRAGAAHVVLLLSGLLLPLRGLMYLLLARRQEQARQPVAYTHLRAHETDSYHVCPLLREKKKKHRKHETSQQH